MRQQMAQTQMNTGFSSGVDTKIYATFLFETCNNYIYSELHIKTNLKNYKINSVMMNKR